MKITMHYEHGIDYITCNLMSPEMRCLRFNIQILLQKKALKRGYVKTFQLEHWFS